MQANAQQHLEVDFLLSFTPKNNSTYSKKKEKNKWVSFHEITCLIIVKMMMKMNNRSHRYEIVLGLDIQ